MEGDADYFGRRAREEQAAASKALHPAAQRVHLEMAERYNDIAAAIASGHGLLRLVTPAGKGPTR